MRGRLFFVFGFSGFVGDSETITYGAKNQNFISTKNLDSWTPWNDFKIRLQKQIEKINVSFEWKDQGSFVQFCSFRIRNIYLFFFQALEHKKDVLSL